MTELRANVVYAFPWLAQLRSWPDTVAQTGQHADCSDLRADIVRGFSEAWGGNPALASDVSVGDITVSQNRIADDVIRGTLRLRPAAAMETRNQVDRQLLLSLRFRQNGHVPQADLVTPYTPLFGASGLAQEPVIADPPAGYIPPDPRPLTERVTSYGNVERSTNPALDNQTPLGRDVRAALELPPWLVAVLIVAGSLGVLVAGAYVYRAVH